MKGLSIHSMYFVLLNQLPTIDSWFRVAEIKSTTVSGEELGLQRVYKKLGSVTAQLTATHTTSSLITFS